MFDLRVRLFEVLDRFEVGVLLFLRLHCGLGGVRRSFCGAVLMAIESGGGGG